MDITILNPADVFEHLGKAYDALGAYNSLAEEDVRMMGRVSQKLFDAEQQIIQNQRGIQIAYDQLSRQYAGNDQNSHAAEQALWEYKRLIEKYHYKRTEMKRCFETLGDISHDIQRIAHETKVVEDEMKMPIMRSRDLVKLFMDSV